MDSDVYFWSRISIQKASISQETFAANRDFMSVPEFGWHSRYSGRLLKMGGLYDYFYYPVGESNAVELIFVESDEFSDDDVIHIFTIEKGNGIHTLKYGNDEFAVVRSKGSTSKRTETAIRTLIFTNQAIMQQFQKTLFGEMVTLRR
jgi:hypothetical protein